MARLLALIAVIILAAGPAWAEGSFGAIAYSPAADNSAAATDKPNRDEAEQAALASCRKATKSNPDSCQSAIWFKNACGALAKDKKSTAWGTGWGDTQKIATNWAVGVCKQYGGTDCKLVVSACSPGGAATIPKN